MFKIGDVVHLTGYDDDWFVIHDIENADRIFVKDKNRSGWVKSIDLRLYKAYKKPETEIEFLDAFKNNFKDGT